MNHDKLNNLQCQTTWDRSRSRESQKEGTKLEKIRKEGNQLSDDMDPLLDLDTNQEDGQGGNNEN